VAAMADEQDGGGLRGIFSPSVFSGWHGGKNMPRMR